MTEDVVTETNCHRVQVRLFGAFRQFGTEHSIPVELPAKATVADLRRALAGRFADNDNVQALLKASAFASDIKVLNEDDPVPEGEVAILPPVCGG